MSPQLYDARPSDGTGDFASSAIRQVNACVRTGLTGRSTVPNIRVRVAPINMIEHVERVGPDFERNRLVNRKLFRQTQVDVRETGPDQSIAVSITKGAKRRIGESGGVEP